MTRPFPNVVCSVSIVVHPRGWMFEANTTPWLPVPGSDVYVQSSILQLGFLVFGLHVTSLDPTDTVPVDPEPLPGAA